MRLGRTTLRIGETMFARSARGLAATGLVAALLACLPAASRAQDEDPEVSEDHVFATGAVPTDEKLLRSFPTTPTFRAFLPEKVDLSRHFPAPGNQGDQGSCVGWAVGYAARAYYSQAAENRPVKNQSNIPSPAYIYNSILVDPKDCDSGSRIPEALDLLQKGVRSLKDFPYNQRRCAGPSAQVAAAANEFRITDWRYVDIGTLDQVKGELAQNNPVVISMRVRKAFHRLRGNRVYQPNDTEETGYHAMTLTGYDERKQAFRVINSWGRKWGDGGFGWISYNSFAKEAREAFVIRVSTQPQPEPIVIPEPSPGPQPGPTPTPTPKPVVDPGIVISGLECGRVTIGVRDGQMVAEGFVGSPGDMEKLDAQLAGKDIKNLTELRPWPQCETLLTLDAQLAVPQRPEIVYQTEEDALSKGSLLVFDIKTPAFPSYLHLAYVQADGNVVHLRQADATTLQTLAPGTQLRLGDGKAGPKFRISEPFGVEMMLAISSRSPLFATPRPQVETEREFLTALRRAIVETPDGQGERLISASYRAFKTNKGGVVPQ